MRVSRKYLKSVAIILPIIILSACKGNVSVEPETPPNNNQSTPPTLTMVQEQVFNKSCALAGCHAGSVPQAGMNLSSGKAYSNLVNITSILNPKFKRVDPGSSSNSFIIKMLRNTGELTAQMPPSGKLNDSVIQLVEEWIDDGAKNN